MARMEVFAIGSVDMLCRPFVDCGQATGSYCEHCQRMLQRGLQLIDVLDTIVKAYPDWWRVPLPEAFNS